MKIKAIMPDKAMEQATLREREKMLSSALSPDASICVDCIKAGPDELDCCTDEAFAAREIVKESIEAEREGYDAIVIYCFSDVGAEAARENVFIPVIAPGELTLSIAGTLCNRFSVITTDSKNIPRTYRRLMKHCVAREKMASVRALDIPIGELRANPSVTLEYLERTCKKAVETDGADGIVLGCLGMAEYGKTIEKKLGVTVFDPAFIAVAFAEMSTRLGLAHGERTYPKFTKTNDWDVPRF